MVRLLRFAILHRCEISSTDTDPSFSPHQATQAAVRQSDQGPLPLNPWHCMHEAHPPRGACNGALSVPFWMYLSQAACGRFGAAISTYWTSGVGRQLPVGAPMVRLRCLRRLLTPKRPWTLSSFRPDQFPAQGTPGRRRVRFEPSCESHAPGQRWQEL